jgi:antitoxin YefM
MVTIKSKDLIDDFNVYCEKVYKGEVLIVSRPKNENIIMMSESEYNKIMKEIRNAQYLEMLDKSIMEANEGDFIVETIDEV